VLRGKQLYLVYGRGRVSQGLLMFAINNRLVNYLEMATAATVMAQNNLSVQNVTVVTDKGSYSKLEPKYKKIADNVFDNILFQDTDYRAGKSNVRLFRDTSYHTEKAPWHNLSRNSAYSISPYEETILLDADYLVQSDRLDLLWGSEEDFRINKRAAFLGSNKNQERLIDPFSIPFYWATVIYFKKSERAELVFDLISHIKDNYEYYQLLYAFPYNFYRNDVVFGIAIHMLSGYLNDNEFHTLPFTYLHSFDSDELIQVDWLHLKFLVAAEGSHQFTLRDVKDIDVHVTNKFSICRHIDRILEVYYV